MDRELALEHRARLLRVTATLKDVRERPQRVGAEEDVVAPLPQRERPARRGLGVGQVATGGQSACPGRARDDSRLEIVVRDALDPLDAGWWLLRLILFA